MLDPFIRMRNRYKERRLYQNNSFSEWKLIVQEKQKVNPPYKAKIQFDLFLENRRT